MSAKSKSSIRQLMKPTIIILAVLAAVAGTTFYIVNKPLNYTSIITSRQNVNPNTVEVTVTNSGLIVTVSSNAVGPNENIETLSLAQDGVNINKDERLITVRLIRTSSDAFNNAQADVRVPSAQIAIDETLDPGSYSVEAEIYVRTGGPAQPQTIEEIGAPSKVYKTNFTVQ